MKLESKKKKTKKTAKPLLSNYTKSPDQIMMLLLMYWVSSASLDQNTWVLLINLTAVKEQSFPGHDMFLNDGCYQHQRIQLDTFCYCLRESKWMYKNWCI